MPLMYGRDLQHDGLIGQNRAVGISGNSLTGKGLWYLSIGSDCIQEIQKQYGWMFHYGMPL